MIDVVTPEEMAAIDAAAPEPESVLIDRAAAALARAAVAMLGGTYGRRVIVVAGPGNNGNDGRCAAAKLARRGVRTVVVDAVDGPDELAPCDLVIDAAFGTGLSRDFEAPDPGPNRVLACDIPSGIDGATGEVLGQPMVAEATVTFAALKPGLLLGAGPDHAGTVHVADIGLDTGRARAHLVEASDVAGWLPDRDRSAHKWRQAVVLVAGSPTMTGAANLAAAAAQRAGAGMVRMASPGLDAAPGRPTEAVGIDVPAAGWSSELAPEMERTGAVGIGPGLGTALAMRHEIRQFVAACPVPLVVDGDALTAVGLDAGTIVAARTAPTVLTPHDGEYERLTGHRPGPDRLDEARSLARSAGCVVLLKGPTTVIAAPDGAVRLVTEGDQRLATAGTGDVLTGILAALLAAGLDALDAAAAAAFLHGRAGNLLDPEGLVAGDLVDALPGARRSVGAPPPA